MPCKEKTEADFYDEIVIDQEAQVVPIYLLTFDGDKLADIAVKFNRVLPTNSKDPVPNSNNPEKEMEVSPRSPIYRAPSPTEAVQAAQGAEALAPPSQGHSIFQLNHIPTNEFI
jgi:hypothetical protein